MNDIDRYIQAATRDNTRRSYRAAIEHFESEWGGFLPATADSIARYLVDYAGKLAISTLRQRLAAIAQWHIDQGFPDPTKSPIVKKVLKGIQSLHPAQTKQAKPLVIALLEQIDDWFSLQIHEAELRGHHKQQLQLLRNRALVLLGFWRGFRSDELSRVRVEHMALAPGEGLTLYLPQTKTESSGVTVKVPALNRLCPVAACQAWITKAGLNQGALFRSINRWGQLGSKAMNSASFIALLRQILNDAGITDVNQFSSHSLRRGFATWANSSGWDIKTLMEYVGWKDVRCALRYIEADMFSQFRHGDTRSLHDLHLIPAAQ